MVVYIIWFLDVIWYVGVWVRGWGGIKVLSIKVVRFEVKDIK